MEDEILEPMPAAAPDPTPADPANDTHPANPVTTGLPELPQDHLDDQKDENSEQIPSHEDPFEDESDPTPTETNNDMESANPVNTGLPEIPQDQEDDQNDENLEENEDDNSVTNVTVIHPPAQQITYQMDDEAIYHMIIDNGEAHPVPVLVTESLIEKDPGIMEKRLEDYTVTEAMLLLIWITLLLRMIFDYLGRRKS